MSKFTPGVSKLTSNFWRLHGTCSAQSSCRDFQTQHFSRYSSCLGHAHFLQPCGVHTGAPNTTSQYIVTMHERKPLLYVQEYDELQRKLDVVDLLGSNYDTPVCTGIGQLHLGLRLTLAREDHLLCPTLRRNPPASSQLVQEAGGWAASVQAYKDSCRMESTPQPPAQVGMFVSRWPCQVALHMTGAPNVCLYATMMHEEPNIGTCTICGGMACYGKTDSYSSKGLETAVSKRLQGWGKHATQGRQASGILAGELSLCIRHG